MFGFINIENTVPERCGRKKTSSGVLVECFVIKTIQIVSTLRLKNCLKYKVH